MGRPRLIPAVLAPTRVHLPPTVRNQEAPTHVPWVLLHVSPWPVKVPFQKRTLDSIHKGKRGFTYIDIVCQVLCVRLFVCLGCVGGGVCASVKGCVGVLGAWGSLKVWGGVERGVWQSPPRETP